MDNIFTYLTNQNIYTSIYISTILIFCIGYIVNNKKGIEEGIKVLPIILSSVIVPLTYINLDILSIQNTQLSQLLLIYLPLLISILASISYFLVEKPNISYIVFSALILFAVIVGINMSLISLGLVTFCIIALCIVISDGIIQIVTKK